MWGPLDCRESNGNEEGGKGFCVARLSSVAFRLRPDKSLKPVCGASWGRKLSTFKRHAKNFSKLSEIVSVGEQQIPALLLLIRDLPSAGGSEK